jgi:ribosomal protein S2
MDLWATTRKLKSNIKKKISRMYVAYNYADALAKKGAKILQTHTRETSYHSIKLHLKQVFQRAYRHEL